jgi:hypothetical protein
MIRFSLLIGAGMVALAAPAPAQQNYIKGATPYLWVETGQRFDRLQSALFAIGKGRGTIRIDPGRWDDCGVQVEGDVTFVAAVAGKTRFAGPRLCEGKAALVLRGHSARVVGFIFENFHSHEGNAAGIRLEKGDLAVEQAWFRNSDSGILSSDDPHGVVSVDHSTFTGLGRCGGYAACAHAIYVNFYDRLTVTHSRFEGGHGGHYLKARAAHVSIQDNIFDDTGGSATNYMIDLPEGATGRISGNWFTQGPHKENPGTLIAVAAEGHPHSSNGLTITGNMARLAPGAPMGPAFVGNWSSDRLILGPNRLGPGIATYVTR